MSHRDRADLGTHLSLGENRGSYVRATDRHLSLRSFRDSNSQSTLPLCGRFVNEKSCGGEVELAGDLDAPLDGARDGTKIGVYFKHPLYLLAFSLVGGEVESLFYPLSQPQTPLGYVSAPGWTARSLWWSWKWDRVTWW